MNHGIGLFRIARRLRVTVFLVAVSCHVFRATVEGNWRKIATVARGLATVASASGCHEDWDKPHYRKTREFRHSCIGPISPTFRRLATVFQNRPKSATVAHATPPPWHMRCANRSILSPRARRTRHVRNFPSSASIPLGRVCHLDRAFRNNQPTQNKTYVSLLNPNFLSRFLSHSGLGGETENPGRLEFQRFRGFILRASGGVETSGIVAVKPFSLIFQRFSMIVYQCNSV